MSNGDQRAVTFSGDTSGFRSHSAIDKQNTRHITKSQQGDGDLFHSQNILTSSSGSSGPSVDRPVWRHYAYLDGYNHPGFRYHSRFPRMDFGGPLNAQYTIDVKGGEQVTAWYKPTSSSEQRFVGFLCADAATSGLMTRLLASDPTVDTAWFTGACPSVIPETDLDTFGATAIARSNPVNPAWNLATALAELYRDGLPSLPGRPTQVKNLGEEYLNLQFAWSPTIHDGADFIRATRDYDKNLDQYLRDSGRLVRRSYGPISKTTSSSSVTTNQSPGNFGVLPSGQQLALGTKKVYTKTETKTWFKGAFTYHLEASVFGRRIAELDHTYGLGLGAAPVWAITPWSWLFDWFTNTREVLQNLDNFGLYGLVMPWGYVMNETITTKSVTWEGSVKQGTGFVPLVLNDRIVTRTRQRARATPYGFGTDWNGFNLFQLSILAALGISRAV